MALLEDEKLVPADDLPKHSKGESKLSESVSDSDVDSRFNELASSTPAISDNEAANRYAEQTAPEDQYTSDGNERPSRFQGTVKKLRKRRGLLIGGTITAALVGFLIFIILFLIGFKLNHIKNLMLDYEFASFNRALSKEMNHMITEDAILSEGSGRLPQIDTPSLIDKLRGYDPDTILRNLGNAGMELDFEPGRLGVKGKLRSITTPEGEVYWREGAAGTPPANAKSLSDGEFLTKYKSTIDTQLVDERGFIRRSVWKDLRENSGISFAKWKEFLEKFKAIDPTPEEARATSRAENDATIADGQTITGENVDGLEEGAKQAAADHKVGLLEEEIKPRLSERFGLGSKIATVSQVVFYLTVICIAHDIYASLEKIMVNKSDSLMREAADLNTKADQQKYGSDQVTTAAINQSNNEYDGMEAGAAYQRAAGEPVALDSKGNPVNDLPEEDYPQQIIGMKLNAFVTIAKTADTVATAAAAAIIAGPEAAAVCVASDFLSKIPFIGRAAAFIAGHTISKLCKNAADVFYRVVCKPILDPRFQIGLAVAEIGLVWLDGGLKAVLAAFTEALPRLALQYAGTEILFGHIIPSLMEDLSGFHHSGQETAPTRIAKVDAGDNLLRNSTAMATGAHKISTKKALRDQAVAIKERQDSIRKQSLAYRWFNLDNNYSLATRFLVAIPTGPRSMMAKINSFTAAMRNPFSIVASLSTPVQASIEDYGPEALYGIQQYGWDDTELDPKDATFNFDTNTHYVESKYEDLQKKYGQCFQGKLIDRELKGAFGDSKYDNCKDVDAKRFGKYVLDCYSVEQLLSQGSTDDTYNNSDCSAVVKGEKGADSTPNPSNDDTPDDADIGAGIDTSSVPCAAGTDAGIQETYQKNSIHLCTVGGITVNASISGQLNSLLTKAKAAGITLTGSGFRSYKTQIQLRKDHNCADIYTASAKTCNPPTARPGTSMHEQGLAIDFSGIGQHDPTNPKFIWLSANAGPDFQNLPSESWHWSTNGR